MGWGPGKYAVTACLPKSETKSKKRNKLLTEGKGHKKRQTEHRTAQPRTLASFRTWGIQQELVVPICRFKVKYTVTIYQLYINTPAT